eukprot:CAMPEP_0198719564 /NCGR_PEP_ID=MMETSP1471-20131121/56995_1 /TAXON_ID=41880 /ORGANISM="Pycnococcus provasolii, Strain RCC733" /LENGTH=42 /DNA_ID= /DNA_START= /DNA_END= /DNA_ORIENTATION=
MLCSSSEMELDDTVVLPSVALLTPVALPSADCVLLGPALPAP